MKTFYDTLLLDKIYISYQADLDLLKNFIFYDFEKWHCLKQNTELI